MQCPAGSKDSRLATVVDLQQSTGVLSFDGTLTPKWVSYIDMFWLIPVGFFLALVALVTLVFVGSVRNARALRRDLDERFNDIQGRLEQQANALADLLTRKQDSEDRK
ncbi:MAG TPA: hypothetical protein VFT26_01360 [Pyrinomonadaceae bacterium]|nr:hypothetical protein [Pyrinomonadaceae bacterium]